MKHELFELINIDKIQVLTDSFSEAIGIASAIIDLSGTVLVRSRWQKICTDFHRLNPQTRLRCIESDTILANQLVKGQKYAVYECRNGLIDAAAPIMIEGEQIANFFIGQFLFEPPDVKYFRKMAREYGFDETSYLEALSKVPVIPKERIEPILVFFPALAGILGEMGLKQIRQLEATAALRESEKRFKDISFSMADLIWEVDEKGVYTYCSENVQELIGYSVNETIGKTLFDFMPPHKAEKMAEIFKEILEKKGVIKDLENWNITKDGRKICLLSNGVPFFDDQGDLRGYRGMDRDITDWKLAEESVRIHAMQQDEAAKFGKVAISNISIYELVDEAVILISRVLGTRYSKVLKHLPDEKKLFLKAGVGWKKGWVGRLIMSDGIQSQGGYSLLCDNPVISEDIHCEKRFSPPPLLTEHNVVSGLTVVIPGKERPYGVLGVHTDKKRMFSSDDANFIQTIANVLADAIELKREKDNLLESEKRFKDISFSMADWIWEVDENGVYTYCSENVQELLGYSVNETIGKTPFDFMPPHEAEKMAEIFKEILEQKGVIKDLENWNISKDGREICLLTNGVPILDENGNVTGYRGVDKDITEAKRAQERIEHLNSVLKAIRNVNQLIVVEKDRESLLRKACDTLIEARGYDAAWLGFLRNDNTFTIFVGSGFREDVSRFCEHVMGGDHPPCIDKALAHKGILVVVDKSGECEDCLLKSACIGKGSAIIRVEHAGRLFGLLAISLVPDVAADEEEKELLKEVADDIAFALHKLELEEARKQAQDALQKRKEQLRAVLDNATIHIWAFDGQWYPYLSKEWYRFTGQDPTLPRTIERWTEVVHPDDVDEAVKTSWFKAWNSKGVYDDYFRLKGAEGGYRLFHSHAVPVYDENGKFQHYQGYNIDITERKRIEEEAFRRNALLDAINKVLQETLTCESGEEVASTCLTVAEQMTGSKFGFIGEVNQAARFDIAAISNPGWDACKMPDSEATRLIRDMEIRGLWSRVLKDEKSEIVNDPASHPDRVGTPEGHPRVTSFLGVPLKYAGRTIGMIGLANKESGYDSADQQDVETLSVAFVEALNRKRAEEQIKASLKEKDVLLQEIHHRVKNNLQVVSSMLNIQARTSKDKNTIKILSESRDSINAMALIHARLYESGNLSEINMKEFIEALLRQLFQSYPVRDTKITSIVRVADYPFPISNAVPVGLIINELLTNAFKYAFDNRKEGKIEVTLSASEKGKISLTVSDDGVGLPEEFDVNTGKTLGLRLIKILAEDQLEGKLGVMSSKEGTAFNIEFEIEDSGLRRI